MISNQRRYDIDWLRVIAIGLLLIYHIAIGFQPWGVFIGFIQNGESAQSIWVPMSMLNVWRIPLLFFVSGMGVCFAMKRRTWKMLIGDRFRRILIPFLFGTTAIVPLHVLLWQNYYDQSLSYVWHPYHLWFLGNIFIYVLLLLPLFHYLKSNQAGKVQSVISRFFATPMAFLAVTIPFVLEAIIINPGSFETYAMNGHGFTLGFLAFFFGFLFVYSGDGFWKLLVQWRFITLAIALGLYLFRYFEFALRSPNYLMAVESCFWIFAVLGFGNKHLNKNSASLRYLSQAAYPVYILHMFFLYLAAWLVFPLDMAPMLKFILSILITSVGCMATYEYIIRRVNMLRVLFGLRPKNREEKHEVNEGSKYTRVNELGSEV